jgi:hypothetical protein
MTMYCCTTTTPTSHVFPSFYLLLYSGAPRRANGSASLKAGYNQMTMHLNKSVTGLTMGVAAIGFAGLILIKQNLPSYLLGQTLVVELTEATRSACSTDQHPHVLLLTGSALGIVVMEATPNIHSVFTASNEMGQCQQAGIETVNANRSVYFLSYSAIHSLKLKDKVVWLNPSMRGDLFNLF